MLKRWPEQSSLACSVAINMARKCPSAGVVLQKRATYLVSIYSGVWVDHFSFLQLLFFGFTAHLLLGPVCTLSLTLFSSSRSDEPQLAGEHSEAFSSCRRMFPSGGGGDQNQSVKEREDSQTGSPGLVLCAGAAGRTVLTRSFFVLCALSCSGVMLNQLSEF